MTATPNFASGASASAEVGAAPAASVAPFVLNLCSSSTPMALAQIDLPELRRFTFFVSRRFEEGRERFRLHMGYFATLAEAEDWLNVVREIYPGAWAGEAPGRKLRERAAAAAAAQAQYAAGPQARASVPPPRPTAPTAVPPPRPTAPAPVPAAVALRAPVVHPAPPLAPAATHAATAASVLPAARALTPPAAAPGSAKIPPPPSGRVAAPRAASPVAQPAPRLGSLAPSAAAAPARLAPVTPRMPPPAAAPARPPQAPPAAPSVAAAAAPPPRAARAPTKPVFEDSNVREVLKALGDASSTGETRLMQVAPPPREATAEHAGLSDTQVLKLLETRRGEDSEPLPADVTDGGAIPLLKPDDTGTRRALKEAVASNAPVAFAVQLQWSVQPAELDKVPPLAIFSAYTLYTVEGSRDGRKWYGLRLGFFSDAISAKQVAHYVRSEFASVAVVPVSPQERARATDQEIAATLAAPAAARTDAIDEFKLIDEEAVAVPAVPARPAPRPAGKTSGRTSRTGAGSARADARGSGKVGARDRRGAQTLEETLEILGAGQLSIDNGNGETLNDSGVRHLRIEVQKNSPFSRLLERLSERLKRP
ncbi:MAG TPA: hypothetical protein VK803_05955 [Steroidobacteraceae bacterium]|jgi:hypothetical protein|nr:hypothetical protein [Steroidobacteraceae bacterium]